MITLAFQKARRTLRDYVICFVEKSYITHVELVIPDGPNRYIGYTCVPNVGVVSRPVLLDDHNWITIEIDGNSDSSVNFITDHMSEAYDWDSILFQHFIKMGKWNRNAWTCSSLIAASIGLTDFWTYTPQSLYDYIMFWQ